VSDASARTLTPEQEQAVARRSEPLLLAAAAGSGKTSVLVERFVRAVREDGLAPARILAITFTERAAGELRERVRARLLELGEREAARDTEAAFVGTFHGFCARLLRTHPLMAGLDPDFEILDEGLAARLRERAFSAALREFVAGERADAVDLVAAYGVDRVQSMIVAVHAQLRSQGQRLPRLPLASLPALRLALDGGEAGTDPDAVVACTLLDRLLGGFGSAYEQLKQTRGAVDFDDLELCARELLDSQPSVHASWSQRFELLMVDEFQDTNPRQLAILRLLERHNLFTVGDELQSIYGFRHADVSLFRARRAELEAHGGSLALTGNFRSRAELLEVVNVAFAQRFSPFAPLRAARQQEPDPEPGAEPAVELLLSARAGWEQSDTLARALAAGLPSAPLWRQAEARMLAQRVAELIAAGHARAGDVAVLLRATGDLDVYERALQLQGLRTLATVGGFWTHQQVGDLLSYLRTLANPLDEQALYSTLASPLVGLTRDGLAVLARAARADRQGAWATAQRVESHDELLLNMNERDRQRLTDFSIWLGSERASAARRTISQLLERAIQHSRYRQHVLALDSGQRRLANVHKLLRVARRFQASEGRDVRGFLDHVQRLADAAGAVEPDAPVEGAQPDAVRLMSIHAAKGLEFPVVCIADLGRAPNMRSGELLVDGPRIGLQLLRLDGAKAMPTLQFEQLCQERRGAEAAEEDRIVYVAMTRARERLLLSGAVDFERWPEPRPTAPTIAWLGPALHPDLPALVQSAQHPRFELPVGSATVSCVLNAPSNIGAVLRLDTAAPTSTSAAAPAGEETTPRDLATTTTAAAARAAGASPVQPPVTATSLSYSALSELERCAYRYYLERVLGIKEERGAARFTEGREQGLEARARGTLVHALLEAMDFGHPLAPSAAEVGQAAGELGIRTAATERDEVAALLRGALEAPLPARIAAAQRIHREHPFAFSLAAGEPLITGVVDLLAHEPGGQQLVLDYKSDRVAVEDSLEQLVERDYGIQRLLYALAVLRDGAASVEVVHWFLARPHEPVSVRYLAAERPRLEQLTAQRLRRSRALMGEFAVSPNPHLELCATCPGRGALCSWDDAHTLRIIS
jgi:ATP-dependent helicase/nuclease subunit A